MRTSEPSSWRTAPLIELAEPPIEVAVVLTVPAVERIEAARRSIEDASLLMDRARASIFVRTPSSGAAVFRIERAVAGFLMRRIRDADYVFRWGGDEFLVVMSCPASAAATRMRALKAEYESAPLVSALGNGVGLSIGCAEAPPGTKDIEAVIAAADANMYLQKRPAAV